jgi:dihydroorotate dehydrogenase (fumarate)
MDLSTSYLGFSLPHPFMPGASPLVDDLDTVRRLEDAGAAALVMHSLFEEQIAPGSFQKLRAREPGATPPGEPGFRLPGAADFALGPDEYLEQIRRIKASVRVPLIASLNGTSAHGWLRYASLIQQAGADALELNLYSLATEPNDAAQEIEARSIEIVRTVKQGVGIPLAVKLSPSYTALPHLAVRLADAGAEALVLFNRFYQPDVDVEQLRLARTLQLSTPAELSLRLRWLAILFGRVRAALAVSGGVHAASDAAKAVLCGAQAVQVVSALLQRGPGHLRTLRQDLGRWVERLGCDSLRQLVGRLALLSCPDASAHERASYMLVLQGYEGGPRTDGSP